MMKSSRMQSRRFFVIASVALACSILTPGTSMAQPNPLPAGPIRIVPFGTAGGPIDIIARTYAHQLQERWSRPIVVDVKPGASGILAAHDVARSNPDGLTVLFTLPVTHINNALLLDKLPYDPERDFQPLSQIAVGGPMIVARADAPYSTLDEFVGYAQKNPGLTYGTWGQGSEAHLLCELLSRQKDLGLIHVPYKSQSDAHNNMLAGILDFAWANPAAARTMVAAGKMKALAITGSSRVETMPEVPTFTELGFDGFDLDSWIGVYGPAGMPANAIDTWVTALNEITALPEVQTRLTDLGFKALGTTPEAFIEGYKKDYVWTAELIKAADVKVN